MSLKLKALFGGNWCSSLVTAENTTAKVTRVIPMTFFQGEDSSSYRFIHTGFIFRSHRQLC